MEFLFILIWIIAIGSFIAKAAKGASGQQRRNAQYTGSRPQTIHTPAAYDAQQVRMDSASQASKGGQTFRNTPGSTYGTTNQYGMSSPKARREAARKEANQSRYAASSTVGSAYGQTKASRLGENAVLLEDRKNDWLAKQLREEAAIYRRGSGFDLGASHNVSCDADDIKRSHARRHNSNGLDRGTFR